MKQLLFYIYIFISLIWSLFYGCIVGFFGGFIAWYQHLYNCITETTAIRKKYPQANSRKYIAYHLKHTKDELQKKKYESGTKKPPDPSMEIFLIVVTYIPLILFFPIKGFIGGPHHVFGECLNYWDDHIIKRS
jgi:hypothetical protein